MTFEVSAKVKIEMLEHALENLMDEHRRLLISTGDLDPDSKEEIRSSQAALDALLKPFKAPIRNSMDTTEALKQARRADFLLGGWRRSFIWYGVLNGRERGDHQSVEQALDECIELQRNQRQTIGDN